MPVGLPGSRFKCVCVWPDAGDGVITRSMTWGSNSPATGFCCCNYLLAKHLLPFIGLIARNGLFVPYLGHSLLLWTWCYFILRGGDGGSLVSPSHLAAPDISSASPSKRRHWQPLSDVRFCSYPSRIASLIRFWPINFRLCPGTGIMSDWMKPCEQFI